MSNLEQPPLIVHIIYALGTGGLENGLVNIINRMPRDKYRHAIVCLTEAFDFKNRITAPNVEIIELYMKSGHELGLYKRLWKTLRRLKPAIVHTRNLAPLEMQLVAFLATNAKRVHGEHGRDIYDLHGLNFKYNLLRRFMTLVVNHYISVSQDLQNWLLDTVKVNPNRVTQIYNGVDQKRFSRIHVDDKKIILPEQFKTAGNLVVGTVGRLASVKDQQSLIDAFSKILLKNPKLRLNLRLVIVGNGPLYEELEERVKDTDLSDVTWMPGDRIDIPELLSAMDIFVLPSLGEGISNTILEAMATGLPIIATDVGGNPELVEQNVNGFLVPVGDSDKLADRIELLVKDQDKRQYFGTASSRKVDKNFNWDKTVESYIGVYDRLLKG